MEGIKKRLEGFVFFKNRADEASAKKLQRDAQKEKLAETDELLLRLDETKKRLLAIRSAFENETDFALLDGYILELSGLEKQYSYLFSLAKKKRLSAFSIANTFTL